MEFWPGFSQAAVRCKLLNSMPIHSALGANGTQLINKLFLCKIFPTLLASVATAVPISIDFRCLRGRGWFRDGTATATQVVVLSPSHSSGLKCALGEQIEAFASPG
jgi:hypothetical protein